jgi:ketosteroid isomerase-like protein
VEKGRAHEMAKVPEDLGRFFVERANAGDVEGLVALYTPDALLAGPDARQFVGTEAIRLFYSELLKARPRFEPGEQASALRCGDLALTSSRLTDGTVTAEVAQHQKDGTWLWIIDQPSLVRRG